MNDRLRTEAEILHRQKSGSDLLAENLKMVQHELEKAQSAGRMRLENEAAEAKAEVALLRKKNEKDTAEFMGSMKAWEATQAELRSALEASKEAEREATVKINQSTADIEELNQRITVYEEKMKLLNEQSSGGNKSTSESAVSNEMLQGQIVDLKSQLNALRNENVKLKEGLAKAKQAGQQYKQLADSAEKQVNFTKSL